ncbi:uncharacterized protein ARMOST_09791 [Armillaria ostoyae]|uniref:Uncharacterized protein n=1 Tax=Armillaria ostoyae TaxID=47428 RepID=A0A284RCJ8_ARMOS|nr:uncharacterized protein ARMOST_09791 [Armillaria ostoyae]
MVMEPWTYDTSGALVDEKSSLTPFWRKSDGDPSNILERLLGLKPPIIMGYTGAERQINYADDGRPSYTTEMPFTSNSVVVTEYLTTWFSSLTDSAQTLSRTI